MVNPFTLSAQVGKLQREILRPLYTMHRDQEKATHAWLLVLTGRVIEDNRIFLEDVAESQLIAMVFKIVKLLGGAEQLTTEDFDRFTAYVKAGGLNAMVKMLLAEDKERVFLSELQSLPPHTRENAPLMLEKSATLHREFIHGYFADQFGAAEAAPTKLKANFSASDAFIHRLAELARKEVGSSPTPF